MARTRWEHARNAPRIESETERPLMMACGGGPHLRCACNNHVSPGGIVQDFVVHIPPLDNDHIAIEDVEYTLPRSSLSTSESANSNLLSCQGPKASWPGHGGLMFGAPVPTQIHERGTNMFQGNNAAVKHNNAYYCGISCVTKAAMHGMHGGWGPTSNLSCKIEQRFNDQLSEAQRLDEVILQLGRGEQMSHLEPPTADET